MLKVLVVDDDHLVRKGLIAMMPWNSYGLEVAGEAGNGRKALEFMENNDVDLLITDLEMPVMNGIELMKKVKLRFPVVRMVVLTFHQDFELIQEALRLGALDYITKVELEHEQLDQVLGRVVDRIAQEKSGHPEENPVFAAEAVPEKTGTVPEHLRLREYSPEVSASILKAVDLIRNDLLEDLHLPEVAKRVNMSRSYFSRCFRDIVGKNFNEYVREARIEHAKILLSRTGRTIGWVAMQSGYPNEKYFTRVFREMTGMQPSEFRKKDSGLHL